MTKDKVKKAMFTGHFFHRGKPARLEDEVPQSKGLTECEHISFCAYREMMLRQHRQIDCYAQQGKYQCGRVKKYYDRFGEEFNQVGV